MAILEFLLHLQKKLITLKENKPMKLTKILILIVAIATIVSCSKTEENVPIINIDDLILTSDSSDNAVVLGEMVNFFATGDDGEDYTLETNFFVNQVAIEGSSYVFDEEGSFTINANYEGVASNNLEFNAIDASEVVLFVDEKKALRGQTVTFSLIDTGGNDISETATFYVNESSISGSTYFSGDEGVYHVYAEYELAGDPFTTESKSFEVYIPKRKVVLEDYTGTWCGFCPRVAAAIEDAHLETGNIAVVAIHETANSNPDPMHFPQVEDLKNEFGVDGLPDARINRNTVWAPPFDVNDFLSMAGTETNLAIAIRSELTGNNLVVEVELIYEEGSEVGDKLVVYVVESGVVYPQTSYFNSDTSSPYYGMGNPIPEFVHNDALRNSLTQIFGDNISSTPAFEKYSRNFTLEIPSDYNSNNLGIVAMIVSSDNTARNAQFADVNEDKEFE